MPASPIIDLADINLEKPVFDKEEILRNNPQRCEFEQLDSIFHIDYETNTAVGAKLQTENEFWVKGHIPGNPLMPGVMMLEMAAQLCSFYYHKKIENDPKGKETQKKFFGFGGVDKVKFRGTVPPGSMLFMICKNVIAKSRIAVFECQGFVNGKMVFEGNITGAIF